MGKMPRSTGFRLAFLENPWHNAIAPLRERNPSADAHAVDIEDVRFFAFDGGISCNPVRVAIADADWDTRSGPWTFPLNATQPKTRPDVQSVWMPFSRTNGLARLPVQSQAI